MYVGSRSECELSSHALIVNALLPFGNFYLIPRGTLREDPRGAIRRSHVLVLHNWDLATDKLRSKCQMDLDYFLALDSTHTILKTGFTPTRLMRYTNSQKPVEEPLQILSAYKYAVTTNMFPHKHTL